MKWVKTTVVVLTVLGGAALTTVWAARQGLLTADDAELRARYALPQSRFVTLDGQQIHYVDEGRGRVVLLLQGSDGSLRMWEDWARILRTDYRVIRFDRPPMGLSSPVASSPVPPRLRVIQALRLRTSRWCHRRRRLPIERRPGTTAGGSE